MNFEQIWKEIKELSIEDQHKTISENSEYKEILKPLNEIIEFKK